MDTVLEEPEIVLSLQLRVAEAYHKDAGKGVARIGADALASSLWKTAAWWRSKEKTRSTP